jgi:hypothetical protein
MTDVKALYQVRGNIRTYFGAAGQDLQPMLSDGGAQIMVQGLPERAELVKLGASWGAGLPTGSAFAPVAAWPTTASNLVLANGEAAGGPTYVVERAWMSAITAGATGPSVILAQTIPVGATGSYTDTTTILRRQLSLRATNFTSNGKLSATAANVLVASQWFPLGPSVGYPSSGVIGNIGQTCEALVQGRILIPPGAALALAGVCAQAAGTSIMGVEWHEVLMNLG